MLCNLFKVNKHRSNLTEMNTLKVQSCKWYNNQYIIASTQITNTEIATFIANLVLSY